MRYIALIVLNLPIVFLALLNIITQYKLGRATKKRFQHQLILWLLILIVLVGSFPVYNLIQGRPAIDSIDLSAFDIVEITAVIFLFYVNNNQRRKLEAVEERLRNLHQELSIKLSEK